MLHKAWNSKEEMPYCFSRSSIKFQGHTGQNITDFDPNWAFPDFRPVAAFKSLRFALFFFYCLAKLSLDFNGGLAKSGLTSVVRDHKYPWEYFIRLSFCTEQLFWINQWPKFKIGERSREISELHTCILTCFVVGKYVHTRICTELSIHEHSCGFAAVDNNVVWGVPHPSAKEVL